MKKILSLFILLAFLFKVSSSFGYLNKSISLKSLNEEHNHVASYSCLSQKNTNSLPCNSGFWVEEIKFENEEEDENYLKKPELISTFLFEIINPIQILSNYGLNQNYLHPKTPIYIVFGKLVI